MTAPPIPVPTVRNTTWVQPLPAPYFVSPSPIRLASFPTTTGRLICFSIREATSIFSQPIIFSAPPSTIRFVSSTIPGVPSPMPSTFQSCLAASSFSKVAAFISCSITFAAETEAKEGNFPSKKELPALSTKAYFIDVPPKSMPIAYSIIYCIK